MKKKGTFIISLDYEIHWGVFDAMSLETYESNLKNVNKVIDRLIELSEQYQIKLTFATVGMLFAGSKDDLEKYNPSNEPSYLNKELNTFSLMNVVGENEILDKLHYAKSTIQKIANKNVHEIGTHTYSHYNCLAPGQTPDQFESDLLAAKEIAKPLEIKLESIVFPKNHINPEHLKICNEKGILSYRGTEKSVFYNSKKSPLKTNFKSFIRLGRLLDGYVNITGHNTYNVEEINPSGAKIVNLPSSRFLRPFIPKLSFLEGLKMKRITKSMKYAAKNNELFHLWWHPHNFGANIEENFKNLETIFKTYNTLNKEYEFKSVTMTELTMEILNK